MCLATLDVGSSFFTTLLSGRMADATCLNAVQSLGLASLPFFHAFTALSAARMTLLHGQLASGGSDCGTRARMFCICVVRFVRYSCLVSSSRALHFPDITCWASGVPLHPCAMHPCDLSRVAGPAGFFSAVAHFSILHPSMPGTLLTAMPFMMPVRDMASARRSSLSSLSESVSSSPLSSTVSVFGMFGLCLLSSYIWAGDLPCRISAAAFLLSTICTRF